MPSSLRRPKPSKPDLLDVDELSVFGFSKVLTWNLWHEYVARRFRNIPASLKTLFLMIVFGAFLSRAFGVPCTELGTHATQNCFKTEVKEDKTDDMLGDFVIATACSHGYFYQLENLIGSIHFWEPRQRIVVYDIGMSRDQLEILNCYVNVSVVPFPFHSHPEHVANLYNYAWKILIIEDAMKRHDSVLMLDSALELRAPLREIKQTIANTGHFSAVQPGSVALFTHPTTFNFLGVNVKDPDHLDKWTVPFYAGGIQGFRADSIAYNVVLTQAVKCAKEELCIHPAGAGRNNHNYDQSVLSVLLRTNGFMYGSDTAERYASFQSFRWTLDETKCDDKHVLVLRKHLWNKAYRKHLRQRAFCSRTLPILPAAEEGDEVVESSLNQRLEGNSSLLKCLKEHHNNRVKCKEFLHEGRVEWMLHSYLVQSSGFAALNVLRTIVFCPVTSIICAGVTGLGIGFSIVISRTFLFFI